MLVTQTEKGRRGRGQEQSYRLNRKNASVRETPAFYPDRVNK